MTVYVTPQSDLIGAECNRSVQEFCADVKVVEVNANSALPEIFTEFARDPRITPATRADIARLFAVCVNGGISLAGDVCLVAPPVSLEGVVPFCASGKSGSPLPSVFGMNVGDPMGVALMTCLQEAVDEGIELMVKLQNSIGVLSALFSHPGVVPRLSFLPYQQFAVFGIKANAAKFVLSGAEGRTQMLDRVSGRLRDIQVLGVFTGSQNHFLPPQITDVVSRNVKRPPPVLPTLVRPPPPSPPVRVEATPRQMASNIIQAVKGVVKHAVKGEAVSVSDEEKARRLLICRGDETHPKCEFFIELQGRCSKCGCYMRFKSRLRSQQCPEGKWEQGV